METQTEPRPPKANDLSADSGRREYRFTAMQLWRMIDAGVIPDHSQVELIRGRIYRMTKHAPHNYAVGQLDDLLRAILPSGFHSREEKTLVHNNSSLPEPDLAIVRGRRADYTRTNPKTSDAVLIVEVCASTRTADYRDKVRLYAQARVAVYWVVDVDGRKLDVFTLPEGSGSEARYAKHDIHPEGSSVSVMIDGREVGRIDAKDVLPPIEEPSKPQNPLA